jgi:hypothetical protein
VIAGKHLRYGGYIAWLAKDVAQCAHEPVGRSFMDVWIDPVHVARRALGAASPALEDEHAVFAFRCVGPVKSETQFYGHVKPRDAARNFDA